MCLEVLRVEGHEQLAVPIEPLHERRTDDRKILVSYDMKRNVDRPGYGKKTTV
jgi:hypothetical protein